MKRKSTLLILFISIITSCYSSISSIKPTEYNNCVSFKINFENVPFGGDIFNTNYYRSILVINAQNQIYNGYSFENNGYYYFFNLPPGDYSILECKVSLAIGQNKFNTYFAYFDTKFIEKSKFKINLNDFQYCGEYSCKFDTNDNISDYNIWNQTAIIKTNYHYTSSNTDSNTFKSNYDYILSKFEKSDWKELILRKYNMLYRNK